MLGNKNFFCSWNKHKTAIKLCSLFSTQKLELTRVEFWEWKCYKRAIKHIYYKTRSFNTIQKSNFLQQNYILKKKKIPRSPTERKYAIQTIDKLICRGKKVWRKKQKWHPIIEFNKNIAATEAISSNLNHGWKLFHVLLRFFGISLIGGSSTTVCIFAARFLIGVDFSETYKEYTTKDEKD